MGTQSYQSKCCGDTQNPAATICELLNAGKLGDDQFGGMIGLKVLAQLLCQGITVNSAPVVLPQTKALYFVDTLSPIDVSSVIPVGHSLLSVTFYSLTTSSVQATLLTAAGPTFLEIGQSLSFAAEPGATLDPTGMIIGDASGDQHVAVAITVRSP